MAREQPGLGQQIAAGLARRAIRGIATGGASIAVELKLLAIAAVVCVVLVVIFIVAVVATQVEASEAGGATTAGHLTCDAAGADAPPDELLPIYETAAEKYELGDEGWSVLAAINRIETNFGENTSDSSAGAKGWMQFMDPTWDKYGVDADGDGKTDVNDPDDAIHGAANYLRASGAPEDWYDAIFAYNHADWYVQDVQAQAAEYRGDCTTMAGVSDDGAFNSVEAPGSRGRLVAAASYIDSLDLPYCWAGGHAPEPGPSSIQADCWSTVEETMRTHTDVGLDCSGAVRWLLVLTGFDDPGPLHSSQFSRYEPGKGEHLTIWISYGDVGHVMVTIDDRVWTTSSMNPAHGPGFVENYSLDGFDAYHLPGL